MKRQLAISCLLTLLTACGESNLDAIKQLVAGEDNDFATMRGAVTGDYQSVTKMASKVQVPNMECTIMVPKVKTENASAVCLEYFGTRAEAEAAFAPMQTNVRTALPEFYERNMYGGQGGSVRMWRSLFYTDGPRSVELHESEFYISSSSRQTKGNFAIGLSFGNRSPKGLSSATVIRKFVADEGYGFAELHDNVSFGHSTGTALWSKVPVPDMDCLLRITKVKSDDYATCEERFATRAQADAAYSAMLENANAAVPEFSQKPYRQHDTIPPTMLRSLIYASNQHRVMVSETVNWKAPYDPNNRSVDYYGLDLFFSRVREKP